MKLRLTSSRDSRLVHIEAGIEADKIGSGAIDDVQLNDKELGKVIAQTV